MQHTSTAHLLSSPDSFSGLCAASLLLLLTAGQICPSSFPLPAAAFLRLSDLPCLLHLNLRLREPPCSTAAGAGGLWAVAGRSGGSSPPDGSRSGWMREQGRGAPQEAASASVSAAALVGKEALGWDPRGQPFARPGASWMGGCCTTTISSQQFYSITWLRNRDLIMPPKGPN
ncbi:uncharacterized protein LOC100834455 [Brachypodium distachyon]|uniref:Ig-like domain-containing protein n=1 Tax=Brachypodium distachyon TaxID=15368 RepID=A0A0Q3H767_BRADI|nr:uncharacterized protein LOC100834455 [Brachypodium distachyon]KQK18848.1 hypothetical protein BRADI_1g45114v3 [Brachypodium distachyon]|eukprot:XP_010227820.1 uncharacterized protein LOC100834455 [Brachypodium distachyon]